MYFVSSSLVNFKPSLKIYRVAYEDGIYCYYITVLILFLKEFNVSQFFTDCGRRFRSFAAEHETAPL